MQIDLENTIKDKKLVKQLINKCSNLLKPKIFQEVDDSSIKIKEFKEIHHNLYESNNKSNQIGHMNIEVNKLIDQLNNLKIETGQQNKNQQNIEAKSPTPQIDKMSIKLSSKPSKQSSPPQYLFTSNRILKKGKENDTPDQSKLKNESPKFETAIKQSKFRFTSNNSQETPLKSKQLSKQLGKFSFLKNFIKNNNNKYCLKKVSKGIKGSQPISISTRNSKCKNKKYLTIQY